MKKPDPKDYPDQPNGFCRAMKLWESCQPRPFPEFPKEIEELFTLLSVQEANLYAKVDSIRRNDPPD